MAFNNAAYIQNKMDQLNKTGFQGKTWDIASVTKGLADAGMTPEQHYAKWGAGEGITDQVTAQTPEGFDSSLYLQNKAAALNATAGEGSYNPGNVAAGDWNEYNTGQALTSAGMTAEQHYQRYGINEGISGVAEIPQLYEPDKFPTSRTGIGQNYIDQIMSSLVPQLTGSIDSYKGDIDVLTGQAVGLARNTTQDMMKEMMQSLTSDMNVRGMTDSTVMSDAMGTATSGILSNLSNQVLQSGMEGAKLNLGMPSMLGQLAGLGQTSTSQDPSIPQRILASIYTGSQ